jgi:hypothetical protein
MQLLIDSEVGHEKYWFAYSILTDSQHYKPFAWELGLAKKNLTSSSDRQTQNNFGIAIYCLQPWKRTCHSSQICRSILQRNSYASRASTQLRHLKNTLALYTLSQNCLYQKVTVIVDLIIKTIILVGNFKQSQKIHTTQKLFWS